MGKDEFETKYEILMKEWDYTQSHIGRFDTIIFQVRSWAITALTGLIAVSASQGKPRLMLLAMLVTGLFWINDGLQKSFQRRFILRSREIENYLSSIKFIDDFRKKSITGINVPQSALQFGVGSVSERFATVIEAAFLRNVLFIYGSMLLVCVVSY